MNVARLGVDLTNIDAAVVSHRHGDHTTGLTHLLRKNPGVTIYVPQEGAAFKADVPSAFLARHDGLPADLRYHDGKPPERSTTGSPWEDARFERVTKAKEILPGFYVLTVQSQKPGTMEMNEVSLAIRTPKGLAVVVGCSHPGVEKILEQAAALEPRLHLVTGGFHLVVTPRDEVTRVADLLRDGLKVERVAPGHCTSEMGFAVFLERFGDRFIRAGLGSTIPLP